VKSKTVPVRAAKYAMIMTGLSLMASQVAHAGAITVTTLYFANAFDYTNSATYHDYAPNLLTAIETGSDVGETVTSSASLTAGTLKILNEGSVDPSISPNTASFASLGDTLTASGATAGLNLGVGITVDGSAFADHPSEDATFMLVAAYAPGVFDSNAYSTPLWAAGYSLGTDSKNTAGLLSLYGVTSLSGTYADGSEFVPISIPFSVLPSTFDLYIAMGSYETGTGLNWTNDFSHTLSVGLTTPNGVTVTSASNALSITSSTPEPSTWSLGGIALLAGMFVYARKRSRILNS
jgi:hypothetical protein